MPFYDSIKFIIGFVFFTTFTAIYYFISTRLG